jgi:hypothetical protein
MAESYQNVNKTILYKNLGQEVLNLAQLARFGFRVSKHLFVWSYLEL